MHSLRARLVALVLVVAGTALVCAALVSQVAVRHEYQILATTTHRREIARAADGLGERLRGPGGVAAADSMLAKASRELREELFLADGSGHVLAASKPELHEAEARRLADGTLEFTIRVQHGGVVVRERARILGVSGELVRAGNGDSIGRLYPFPKDTDPERATPSGFLPAVNRALLLAVAGGGVLAVLLALALTRRILRPVELLTRAARRMEAGERGVRVGLASRDEIGDLARAFDAMATSVARSETLRRGLVSDVAHELRTPLTNLQAQIEAIEDGLAAPDPATIRSLHDEVLLLARLVDDLQELALAEAGQLPLHRETVAPATIVAASLAAVGAAARKRGIHLASNVAADTRDVDADPARLAQVLRNLLENALTHTADAGSITVTARPHADGVEIAVEDTGEGIAPEHLPHVFDRFYRADPSRSRSSGNAGLGLAIARQFIDAHGGRIGVESRLGEGTRFAFVLSAARSS